MLLLLSAGTFATKLLDIGDGKLPLDHQQQLHRIPVGTMVVSSDELIAKVYPNLTENYLCYDWLRERAILAPRNDIVEKINQVLLEQLPGQERTYRSIDSTLDQEEAVHYPVEFLNSKEFQNNALST